MPVSTIQAPSRSPRAALRTIPAELPCGSAPVPGIVCAEGYTVTPAAAAGASVSATMAGRTAPTGIWLLGHRLRQGVHNPSAECLPVLVQGIAPGERLAQRSEIPVRALD